MEFEQLESRKMLATLGTAALVEGTDAGSDSDLLVESSSASPWSASSATAWLHVAPASAGGSGSGTIVFNFDANTSPAVRTGTISIADQTLTVTQAPSGFVANARQLRSPAAN